jgi:putative transposase
VLRTRLKELAAKHMRFGYRRLTAMLAREGIWANHKRVYRLYREEGLAMRIRQRRRIRWHGAVTSPAATRPNERWSMDFVSDCVSSGKVILTVDHRGRLHAGMPSDRGRYLAGRTTCASSAGSDGERARTAGSDCCGQRTGVSWTGTGGLERTTRCPAGVHSTRHARAECLHGKLQRPTARRMSERELVHQSQRCAAKDRNLATGLQRTTSPQFVELLAARRVCTDASGDADMRKTSTELLEQGIQAPSPAPYLIPAEANNQPRTHIGIGTANGALQHLYSKAASHSRRQ